MKKLSKEENIAVAVSIIIVLVLFLVGNFYQEFFGNSDTELDQGPTIVER